MGYDMYRQGAPENAEGESYFRLNIWGMGKMRALMCAILSDDKYPPFVKKPDDWSDEQWDEYNDWSYSADPDEKHENPKYNELLAAEIAQASYRASDPALVPVRKFGSNDRWIVTPDECKIIAAELQSQLDNGSAFVEESDNRWREIVEKFVAFNLDCAKYRGYKVH